MRQFQAAQRRAAGEAQPAPTKPVKPVAPAKGKKAMGGFKFGAGGTGAAPPVDAPLKRCFIEEIDSDEDEDEDEVSFYN